MKARWITKYRPDTGEYGAYDTADRAIVWIGDEARAKSAVARLNAPIEAHAHIQAAIDAIGVALTGNLHPAARETFVAARASLRRLNQTHLPMSVAEAAGEEVRR